MNAAVDSIAPVETDRRKFLLGLLFCTAAGVAAWRQPHIRRDYLGNHKLDELVPKRIGRWDFVAASGLVVPPQDQLANAVYSQMLTRVYSDGKSSSVMLLIAQSGSQTGFLQIHRPETCYTASGYQVSPVIPHPIRIGSGVVPANRMDAFAEGQTEHVIYWTRVGNQIPGSWKQQKLAVAEQNLDGIIPDAILVRISVVDNDAASALATIDEFVRAMLDGVPANMRSVFVV